MIFNLIGDFNNNESYKERNLYYKLFAGYLFNELLEGADNRKSGFFQLLDGVLNSPARFKGDKQKIHELISGIANEPVSVTFDYHSSQVIKSHRKEDKGEMSDVLLLSPSYLISIECKFLEDMKFGKDVEEVQDRISEVSTFFGRTALQVLLMKKSKWDEAEKLKNHKGSFYTKFQQKKVAIPVIILFWDDLVSLISEPGVKSWLEKQIERKKIKD